MSDASNTSHPFKFNLGNSALNIEVFEEGQRGVDQIIYVTIPTTDAIGEIEYYCELHPNMGNAILISDGVTPTWFGENSEYILDSWLTKFTPDLVDLGLPDDLQFVQYTDTTGALVSSSTDYVLPLTVDTEINTRDELVWWEIHPDVQSGFVINGFNLSLIHI